MSRPGDRLRALASYVFDAEAMEVALKLRTFVALLVAFTVLLEVPALLRWRFTTPRVVYLIPQAFVVAVPVSLTLAIAAASRSLSRPRQALRATIGAGAVCAVLVFVTFAWLVPSANQSFRLSVARDAGLRTDPAPGLPEMTIGELYRQTKWAATRVRADWRIVEFTYHYRWAFSSASLFLAFLMASLGRRGATRRTMLLAALPILFGYYVLTFLGREYAIGGGALPIVVYVWMPNMITALTAAAAFGIRHAAAV